MDTPFFGDCISQLGKGALSVRSFPQVLHSSQPFSKKAVESLEGKQVKCADFQQSILNGMSPYRTI